MSKTQTRAPKPQSPTVPLTPEELEQERRWKALPPEVTTDQVAAVFTQYSRLTVTHWCRTKAFPCRRVGRSFYIRKAVFDAFRNQL